MDNNLFIKNILILIFCVILIHIFLNDFLDNKTWDKKGFNNEYKEGFNTEYKKGTNNEYKEGTNNEYKTLVYLFYADWCGH